MHSLIADRINLFLSQHTLIQLYIILVYVTVHDAAKAITLKPVHINSSCEVLKVCFWTFKIKSSVLKVKVATSFGTPVWNILRGHTKYKNKIFNYVLINKNKKNFDKLNRNKFVF